MLADFQLEAQRRSVRAAAYLAHLPAYVIAENQIDHLGSPKLAILPSPQALGDAAWKSLLQYVQEGGNLLVTGPVDRDQHWQIVHRAFQLGIDGHVEPLTYHDAELKFGDQRISLSFGQQQQNWLDSYRFDDGSTLKEFSHGKGRIFWAAYPVELAEKLQAPAELYSYVAAQLKIAPPFSSSAPLSPGVLVFPIELADSILYVLVSDTDTASDISIRDQATGVPLAVHLPAEHAAMALIGKKERKTLVKYGF